VTARWPDDTLYEAVQAARDAGTASHIVSLKRIGDCYSPSTIQAATYAGHRWARELDDAEASEFYPRELPKAAPLRRFWGHF
jgi:dimethylamine/trimethylamine dehydrogenase